MIANDTHDSTTLTQLDRDMLVLERQRSLAALYKLGPEDNTPASRARADATRQTLEAAAQVGQGVVRD